MNCKFIMAPDRPYKWRAYTRPGEWPNDFLLWMYQTFGPNGQGEWDYHGGWVFLGNDEQVALFKLKWQVYSKG